MSGCTGGRRWHPAERLAPLSLLNRREEPSRAGSLPSPTPPTVSSNEEMEEAIEHLKAGAAMQKDCEKPTGSLPLPFFPPGTFDLPNMRIIGGGP